MTSLETAVEKTASSVGNTIVQIDVSNVQQAIHTFGNSRPLSSEEASRRLAEYGPNVISAYLPLRWYRVLYNATIHPFNMILIVFATFSGTTRDFETMAFLLIMIIMSVGLRFHQEYKNEVAAQSLKSMVSNKATVIRLYGPPDDRDPNLEDIDKMDRGEVVELETPLEEVVPGDWIKLSAGDLIPGDVQLLSSKDLFVSQASLTGEAIPVEKFVTIQQVSVLASNEPNEPNDATSKPPAPELDRPDLCFMGTSVVSGTATAMVLKTGSKTFFGTMATDLAGRRPPNAFQIGIRRISVMFIAVMLSMMPPVLLLQGFLNHDWWGAVLFAVAVGVGLTPEMLPMIVNANLARGAINLSKKKCIVKHLDAIINLGGIDILCTDKTGTLTCNKVALIKHVDHLGHSSACPLRLSFLNSFFQTGLKNLMDIAIIEFFEDDNGKDKKVSDFTKGFLKVDEIPFDFVRRRMSVILEADWDPEYRFLISKGAVDEMLECCENIYIGQTKDTGTTNDCPDGFFPTANIVKITPDILQEIRNLNENLNNDGLRVIAVAYKRMKEHVEPFTVAHESGLTLVGFCAFLDPPKASAKPAIQELFKYNVGVKVLTGDSPTVCRKVCQEIELPVTSVVTNVDLEGLDDAQMEVIAESATIFAKLTPVQKASVVKALKRRGHIVGFLGDGINDAPAIRESDCGISVDEGTDIAKESADIILLEKSLLVLVDGVVGGRTTYGNTIKYIKMAVSSNFGNVFSIMIASAWLPFLPMLPLQVIVQNFLYDISQISIPWDVMDPEYLLEPKRWNAGNIVKFMACIGPFSSIFDVTTFLFMWYYYGCSDASDYHQALFQTAWFVEGLCTQTLIVHIIRTPKIPFIQSIASTPVLIGTFAVVAVAVSLPFNPIHQYLGMVGLPGFYYVYLIGALLGYFGLTLIAKAIYLKVFKTWL